MSICLTDIIYANDVDFIGLQETMKKSYNPSYFRKLDPEGKFKWEWIPSRGKSGGSLGGVDKDKFDLINVKHGKYILQMDLFDKGKKCNWALLVVYGAAQDENKPEFIAELSSMCNNTHIPYLVGGDFNILRHSGEKNKKTPMSHFSEVFNSVIHLLGLREISMSGGCYTWSNKQENPTLEKLDRVLMSYD